MKNLLEGLKNGEERHTHANLFRVGLQMVDCLIRNLNSDQVFELRDSVSEIAKAGLEVWDNIKCKELTMVTDLGQLQYCKAPNDAKKLVKKATSGNHKVNYVTVGLVDAKKTA